MDYLLHSRSIVNGMPFSICVWFNIYQCYRNQRHTDILATYQRPGTMYRPLKRYQLHDLDNEVELWDWIRLYNHKWSYNRLYKAVLWNYLVNAERRNENERTKKDKKESKRNKKIEETLKRYHWIQRASTQNKTAKYIFVMSLNIQKELSNNINIILLNWCENLLESSYIPALL